MELVINKLKIRTPIPLVKGMYVKLNDYPGGGWCEEMDEYRSAIVRVLSINDNGDFFSIAPYSWAFAQEDAERIATEEEYNQYQKSLL